MERPIIGSLRKTSLQIRKLAGRFRSTPPTQPDTETAEPVQFNHGKIEAARIKGEHPVFGGRKPE